MAIDEKLNILLKDLTKSPRNTLDEQTVMTLTHTAKEKPEEKIPIVSLYFGDKYAQFHDEFTQTARNNSELKPLVDYLVRNHWETNLD